LTDDLRCLFLAVLLIGRGDTDFAHQLSMQPTIDLEAVQAHLSVRFDIINTELYNLLDLPTCRLGRVYYTIQGILINLTVSHWPGYHSIRLGITFFSHP
jgi:hypothetical protein